MIILYFVIELLTVRTLAVLEFETSSRGPVKAGPDGPLAKALNRVDLRERSTEESLVAEHSRFLPFAHLIA